MNIVKCPNCDQRHIYPGKMVWVDGKGRCIKCGSPIQAPTSQIKNRWDHYFHNLCLAVAFKSPCMSRKIGSIIVRDHSVVATGYNGPARDFPHCEGDICPRQLKGYKSGEGLDECPAAHAETNCIANAARLGVSVHGATLYLNSVVPCKFCMVSIVNSGIYQVVCEDLVFYHEMSKQIASYGGVRLRTFQL